MPIKELDKLLISIAQKLGNKTPKSVKTIISLLEKYEGELSSGQRKKLYDFLRTAELDLFNLKLLDRETMTSLAVMIEDVRRGKEELVKKVRELTEDFIYVPSIKLWVSKERKLQGLTWEETHEALKKQGYQMLTIPEFIEFLKFVRKNYPEIYEDMTAVRHPWRGEWLDAFFKEENGQMYIYTINKTKKEKLIPCLKENASIDEESWLNNPTKQGLPREDIKRGDRKGKFRSLFHYLYPTDNEIAIFHASSINFGLFWGRYHIEQSPELGVRLAKK